MRRALQLAPSTAACAEHCSWCRALQHAPSTAACAQDCSMRRALQHAPSTAACAQHCSLRPALQLGLDVQVWHALRLHAALACTASMHVVDDMPSVPPWHGTHACC
eukprot:264999-Chlamydomonas_euryale.AAC.1